MMINVQTVAVIGSGTMGAGIAEVAASHGHQVLLYDIYAEALTRAIDGIHARLNSRVKRGKLTAETCERTLKRLIPVTDIHALAAADLVIEAASERLEVKKALFAQLAEVCPPQTLLTTNTSSISITAIAAEVKNPERVAGLHFFNPAPVMKLVEVVSGLATAAEVVEQLCELTLSWGKQPVRCHSTPGFIVNRVARPYYSEAWRALEEQVAAPEVIDAALRDGAGFPMGPLELTDLIGQDVNFAVTCSVFNAFWQERRFLPSLVQQELVIGGRLGKKSGLGVYDWRAEREEVVGLEAVSDSFSPMKVENKSDGVTEIDDVLLIETQGETAQALATRLARPVVVVDKMTGKVVTIASAAVNPDSATRKAIYYLQQQGKTVLQIADYPGMLIWRTVAMIINEALDALQKGVASEQDIDTAMRLGVNYPYGPLAWGAQLGWQRILRLLENLQHHYGEERYRPCSLLRQRALLESGYES
ncbi:3-hydroxyacyl-CoA dehydrogenase PaaH [Escherichia fergusonii]|uniref:3-hydroxyacyl-CoA dehydrogenase PaaC n=1 Tax=Escherichia fergusonii TaxID=564 RepID=A0A7W3EEM4_ESCFE|nr:3-hydroxyacyl-CoA dehydrogenase PaaH [Escherichia fergusonii]EHG6164697.1 3-hydroxyacyl-CoA dehydrogenase PaaC [Escherichia fergusonii]EHG7565583.1 3-hydroxyacyl-CoA dehydrogenase PaaC [Escherichia fergusonii]MBA8234084.1 3-hydroxyacyl-CoA dehydrogenase PaaC [Escherichia fergusonii]MBA8244779.1 3-hydroxyacyl-CoA dehydrogenase PaaC [Escherichia fergusonii]MCP9677941.1 3-hydroxyacyl-CoA dehydrogenase PaaC [Escherichia fergusonii]